MWVRPKKSLGQNFLIDRNIIDKICETGLLKEGENILEIGPGTGNLTEAILKKKPEKFYVIEKDEKLAQNLKEKFSDKIIVINKDVLKYDFKMLNNKNFKVFGNLPYNISSQILTNLIKYSFNEFSFEKLIFMFQKEVADRIIAKYNTKNYGRLSIISSWKLNIKKITDIAPSSFFPKPKIISSLLEFTPKSEFANLKNSENLEKITNIFFNQRRKMIKKPLNILFQNSKNIIKELNLDTSLRPQNLNPETYLKICLMYEKLTC